MDRELLRSGIRKTAFAGMWNSIVRPGLKALWGGKSGVKNWWSQIKKPTWSKQMGIPGEKIFLPTEEKARQAWLSRNKNIVNAIGDPNKVKAMTEGGENFIHNIHGHSYDKMVSPLKEVGSNWLGGAKAVGGQVAQMGMWMGIPMAMSYFMDGSGGGGENYSQQMANQYGQYYENKYNRDMLRNIGYTGTGMAAGYALGDSLGGYGGAGATIGGLTGLGISSVRNKYEY